MEKHTFDDVKNLRQATCRPRAYQRKYGTDHAGFSSATGGTEGFTLMQPQTRRCRRVGSSEKTPCLRRCVCLTGRYLLLFSGFPAVNPVIRYTKYAGNCLFVERKSTFPVFHKERHGL
jgi:hypothetical protein